MSNRFKKGFIIYLTALLSLVFAADVYIWARLKVYEKTSQIKSGNNGYNSIVTIEDPVNTPTPTSVPEAEYTFMTPEGIIIYADGEKLETTSDGVTFLKDDRFSVLYEFSGKYSEYKNIEADAMIPKLVTFKKKLKITAKVEAYTSDMKSVELDFNEESKTYKCGYVLDETGREELEALAEKLQQTYAMFCANDVKASELKPYFPDNSQYLKAISSVDNSWYAKHTGLPKYTDRKTNSFIRYSEKLVYIDMSVTQTIRSTVLGKDIETQIRHKFWLYNTDKGYKVAAIEF
ncbi:MAG: hypothetical protein PUB67_00940 [Clostridiales bacterium]|nr:hypothetical protein [Clostridiales bacterium]